MQVLMENAENIEFLYTLAGGTKKLDPTGIELRNIRSVEITILARASRPSEKYRNTQRYVTASGAVWGPYNDQFRRRMLITKVKCRNMGW
jgi:type IV pilus assembly protein PilW